ncbi:MAG: hypothetical protein K2N58_02150 [Treponemataceae bacterium]|nr:hypothetical protein [Treponemataceae bacterium]
MGGVLVLSAILAISLTFASCANSSNSDDENPSPSLPENVGENPIKETIKLIPENDSYHYLELKADGSALYISDDDGDVETALKFKYTYDAETKRIHMKLEKAAYGTELSSEATDKLLTYNEYLSKLDEDFTEKNMKQTLKKEYDENKDKEWFKRDYPDCNSYEDYEKEILKNIKEAGFDSFDAYVKDMKRYYENDCKSAFGAQTTYSYKITDGKMTLTEKFTGVKNLLDSQCEYRSYDDGQNSTKVRIRSTYAEIYIYENGIRYDYDGTINTDNRTIDFKKSKRSESDKDYEPLGNVNATYTEEIDRGRVTINCEGKEYVCEFEGEKYTQE